ncbi:hypothetical protein AMAG_04372 [Allomyces macrogynus ATCC 38327]|uniref:Uncharacterized protein n=1 Tax=Allomyces macrogynus (strain ATCC 38327) TaxID=578462 RepID=A0A0L0S8M5_ALLM3|nr:hypothetical protein AMAG_04372 [Allomyces macrogynus ATCC 38327]|eukprot:KNE58827.1 hypothetical protein AMAG_04372 [Allomyces macrogynus ATCC 38327]
MTTTTKKKPHPPATTVNTSHCSNRHHNSKSTASPTKANATDPDMDTPPLHLLDLPDVVLDRILVLAAPSSSIPAVCRALRSRCMGVHVRTHWIANRAHRIEAWLAAEAAKRPKKSRRRSNAPVVALTGEEENGSMVGAEYTVAGTVGEHRWPVAHILGATVRVAVAREVGSVIMTGPSRYGSPSTALGVAADQKSVEGDAGTCLAAVPLFSWALVNILIARAAHDLKSHLKDRKLQTVDDRTAGEWIELYEDGPAILCDLLDWILDRCDHWMPRSMLTKFVALAPADPTRFDTAPYTSFLDLPVHPKDVYDYPLLSGTNWHVLAVHFVAQAAHLTLNRVLALIAAVDLNTDALTRLEARESLRTTSSPLAPFITSLPEPLPQRDTCMDPWTWLASPQARDAHHAGAFLAWLAERGYGVSDKAVRVARQVRRFCDPRLVRAASRWFDWERLVVKGDRPVGKRWALATADLGEDVRPVAWARDGDLEMVVWLVRSRVLALKDEDEVKLVVEAAARNECLEVVRYVKSVVGSKMARRVERWGTLIAMVVMKDLEGMGWLKWWPRLVLAC